MNEEIRQLEEKIGELFQKLNKKQDSQYKDIMSKLDKIDQQVDEDYDSNGMTFNELYAEARRVVIKNAKASTSYLQRKLGIGYLIACDLIDKLEEDGVISEAHGVRSRDVLIKE